MKEFLLQSLRVAYGLVGGIGIAGYWPTIKDLHHHKKPSANTLSFVLWTTAGVITFLYSIFILQDLLFRIISGLHFVSCSLILFLLLRFAKK